MTEKDLKQNISFVEEKKDDLLKTYRNKFIIVFNREVVGSYDTYEAAAKEAIRMYGIEAPFLVHHLMEEEPVNVVMEAVL